MPAPPEALAVTETEKDTLPLGERVGVLVTLCESEREAHLLTLGERVKLELIVPHGEPE